MLNLVIATNNSHKLQEYREIFKGYNINIIPMNQIVSNLEIDENGKTFKQNALIKAKSLQKCTNLPILADDSGIIIEFLGKNFPGIYSHRFSQKMGGQEITNKYLINRAKKEENKKAHFVCTLCLLNLSSKPLYFVGKAYGKISKDLKGIHGFGYDPIFILNKLNKTFAELEENEKNSFSHRANACKKLLIYLKENNFI